MTQADSIALLISLQERVNKVFDDIKSDRDLDREQLNLLIDRVEKLEQAGNEVKKSGVLNSYTLGGVMGLIQNPIVLFAIITILALCLLGKVDLNVVIVKLLEYFSK